MTIVPPAATAILLRYRIWSATQRTAAWQELGECLALYVATFGIEDVQDLVTTHGPHIPWDHLELALSDQRIRATLKLLHA